MASDDHGRRPDPDPDQDEVVVQTSSASYASSTSQNFSEGEDALHQPTTPGMRRRKESLVHPVVKELQAIQEKLINEQRAETRMPWVNTTTGNMFFGVLILLNSVFTGVDIELSGDNETMWPLVVESLFLAAFWVEISLRIMANGFRGFFCDRWGFFDFACTLLGSVEAWVLSSVLGDRKVAGFSALRTLRLLRLLRLLRIFQTFKGLAKLATVLANSFQSMVWLGVLFILIIYISSITIYTLLVQHADEDEDIARVTKGLGWTAFYHVMVVTSEGYIPVWVEPTMRLSSFWLIYWVIAVVWLNLFMLNMTVGVLVQQTLGMRKNEEEALANLVVESDQFRSTLLTLFGANDIDEDGTLDAEELMKLLDDSDLDRILRAFNIKTDVPRGFLYTVFGLRHTPQIKFQTFYETCVRICGSNKDIRSFMLQVDIATMKDELLERTKNIRSHVHKATKTSLGQPPSPRSKPKSAQPVQCSGDSGGEDFPVLDPHFQGEGLHALLLKARQRMHALERQQDEIIESLSELRAAIPSTRVAEGSTTCL